MKKVLIYFLVFSPPLFLLAQESLPKPTQWESIEKFLEGIAKFIFYFGFSFFPLAILIGAILILTSGGDPERVKKGWKVIIVGIIGLAIILFGKGIPAFVRSIFKPRLPSS